MGTKNEPGKFDCYAKAEPDEPIFVLRAKDAIAPYVVFLWAGVAECLGVSPEKVAEAKATSRAMVAWFGKRYPEKVGRHKVAYKTLVAICRAAPADE